MSISAGIVVEMGFAAILADSLVTAKSRCLAGHDRFCHFVRLIVHSVFIQIARVALVKDLLDLMHHNPPSKGFVKLAGPVLARWMYMVVLLKDLCPSSFWMVRRSVPLS